MLPPKENHIPLTGTKGKVGVKEKAYGGGGSLRWECFVDAFFVIVELVYYVYTPAE